MHVCCESLVENRLLVPTPMESNPTRNKLRVPREDGKWLLIPDENSVDSLVHQNSQHLTDCQVSIQGRSLRELRNWSRQSVLRAAEKYTASWLGSVELPPVDVPLIVTGHQPGLFHPGVWAKNFAAARVARRLQGGSLNLIVDNDTVSHSTLQLPNTIGDVPSQTRLEYDLPPYKQPWESARILDTGFLRSFPERFEEISQRWDFKPLLYSFWPRVVAHQSVSTRLADCFAAARNQQEREWGAENLELPLSHLCQLPPFLWFTCHLLAHAASFREIYNRAVDDYRRSNGVHSLSHPVPDLALVGEWIESPFWVWQTGAERRGRLFVRQTTTGLSLSIDGRAEIIALTLSGDGSADAATQQLVTLQSQGWHIRTRALTTTLFSRVFLSDLFIHGIGGAKYDEITNTLITQFLGIAAPDFWTVTGTLQLPFQARPVSNQDLYTATRRLRNLRWNPFEELERIAETPPQFENLRQQFAQFVDHMQTPGLTPAIRHAELTRLKREVEPWMQQLRPLAEKELMSIQQDLEANRILLNREYSYVLYPEQKLREFLVPQVTGCAGVCLPR